MPFADTNYKPPEGNYMKFKEGINKFRILSPIVTGYEIWIEKKPVRSDQEDFTPEQMAARDVSDEGKQQMNHFWAMAVWNYNAEKVQLLAVTQKSVQEAIMGIELQVGDNTKYDLSVTKKVANGKTSYPSIIPLGTAPLSPEIEAKYKATHIDLRAYALGRDPFATPEIKK